MSTRWYYQLLMEEFGPVTHSAIHQLLADGMLSQSDVVRAEDSQEWISIASMLLLQNENSEPEIISDLSELTFDFEDTGVSEQRSDSSATLVPSVTPEKPPQYYTQSIGQTLGPMSFADLVGMAESGALDHSDLVRHGDGGEWKSADDYKELIEALNQGAAIVDAPISNAPPSTRRLFPTSGKPADETGMTASDPGIEPAYALQDPSDSTSASKLVAPDMSLDVETSKEATSVAEEPKKTARKRSKKSKASSKEADDTLLNDIFDDVFADNEKPSRASMPAAASAASSPTMSVSAVSPQPNLETAVKSSRPEITASTASAEKPPVVTPAAAPVVPAVRPAAATVPTAPPRAKKSFQFDGPVRNITILIAVILVAGLVWKFVLPSVGGVSRGNSTSRLKEVIAQYKALGDSPYPSQWQALSQTTRVEFMTYYKAMTESGATGGSNAALAEGLKSIIKLAEANLDNKEQRKILLEKAEKAISIIQ